MPDGWEAVQGKLASLVGEPTLDSLPAIRLRPTTAGQVALPRSKYEARTFTQSDLSVHFVRNTQLGNCGPSGRSCCNTNTQGLRCHAGLCTTSDCVSAWGICTQPVAPVLGDGCETDPNASDTPAN